jgi:lipopolysaccharide export system permease protein
MSTIDRYLIRTILRGVFTTMAVLLSLGALFVLMGEQNDVGVGDFSTCDALMFTALSLPLQAWDLLPISALIGSLLGLGALARGSELTILRAAGFSVWRIARAATFAGLLLTLLAAVLGEFLGPPMQQFARQQKTFSKYGDLSLRGTGDAWVRDGDLIINVERQTGDAQFGGMVIYELDDRFRLRALGRAAAASTAEDGRWTLEQYTESRFGEGRVAVNRTARRELRSAVSAEFLGIAASSPDELPAMDLWRMIRHLEQNNLDANPARFALWSRVARTVATVFAVLLALPFLFGSLRAADSGTRLAFGLVIGIGLFVLQRGLESGTVVFNGNPVLFAWFPTLLMAAVAIGLIARTR